MMNLKYFTKTGNIYKMKPQEKFNLILIIAIFVFAFLGYYAKLPIAMWLFLILGILALLSIKSKRLIIDLDQRLIIGKTALAVPEKRIPLDDIKTFEMTTVSTNLVRTNTSLQVYYIEDGKEKSMMIAQGFTKTAMQNIYNELQDILENDRNKR